MKKIKKFAALVMAGVMMLCTLTACGTKNAIGEKVVEETFKMLNAKRAAADSSLKELKNDKDLQNELLTMLAKIDENGEITERDAQVVESDSTDETILQVYVGFPIGESLLGMTRSDDDKVQAVIVDEESCGAFVEYQERKIVKDMAPYIKEAAVAYRVTEGGVYVAVAYRFGF